MKKVDEKIKIIKKACEDRSGHDIEIIDISDKTTLSDYFIVVTGNTTIQVKAIHEEISAEMSDAGFDLQHREGYETRRWILMDYGDVIVHILHKDERDYYKLERLWKED